MADLALWSVTKCFATSTALDDVSLEIRDGEFLALLGPSGCGKSTLLRALAGLCRVDSGRILAGGVDITHVPAGRRDLAMVFQSYALYPHLSVASNIAFPLKVRHCPRAEIAETVGRIAGQLGLDGLLDRKPREISGGQRQRVALARAMVRRPQAYLLDEPMSNLDVQLRAGARAEIDALHRSTGGTFVYVTHDQSEALALATRIAVLDSGRVQQVGTPAEIYDQPANSFVAGFVGSPPMNLLTAWLYSADGQVNLRAAGTDLALWPGTVEPREVIFGIRPEHLRPAADGLAARLTSADFAGHEQVAWCETTDGQRLAVRLPARPAARPGEQIHLGCEPAHICLFDRSSGRRLIWQPGTRLPHAGPAGAGRAALAPAS